MARQKADPELPPSTDTAGADATKPITRRRLTDDDRQKIRELHAERKRTAEIATEVSTSVASVLKVLAEAGLGRRTRGKTSPPLTSADTLTTTQRRLMGMAIAYLQNEPIDEAEKSELAAIVQARIEEARRNAVQQALASL